MLTHAVDVYPGSSKFLRETIEVVFRVLGIGAIVTCVVLVFWAGSWVFAVIERALNRIWGATSRTFWHGRALTIGMVGLVGLLLSLSVMVTSILVASARYGESTYRHDRSNDITFSFRRQCVLASIVCGRELSDYGCAVRAGLSLHAAGAGDSARHFAGSISGGAALGNCEVHLCVESELLSLRSDLWSVGAVVAVLTWSYVSSLILLFGAQLTAVFHHEHPSASEYVHGMLHLGF